MASTPERNIYRPGATLVTLFIWAVLTSIASTLALEVALHRAPSEEAKWSAYLIVVFGVLFGPVAFLVHFARFCLVSIMVSPEEGLLFSGGRVVPWKDIRSMELKEAALKGLIRMNPALLFFTAGCMAVVCYVVLPSMVLFTPWHSRVIIVLQDGQTVVLRDYRHAEELMKEASRYLPPASLLNNP